MRYKIDHDYHIHSKLSLCSGDPEQSNRSILSFAEKNGLKKICLTDHFWDENIEGASKWYKWQDFSHVCEALPLPPSDKVEFLFGAETDLNKEMTLGIAKERFEKFEFVIIPTTHLHMTNNISEEDGATVEGRARVWLSRLDGVLDMDLPFGKIGIAHLACSLISKERADYLKVMQLLPENELRRIFTKAARVGVGIELNMFDMKYSDEEKDIILRPFRIAKECGCKFYLGSDVHHPEEYDDFFATFERAITDLELTEDDKFHIS